MTDFTIVPEPELIPRILDRIPEFRERWDEHVQYWEGNDAGIFNDLAEFSHFVVEEFTAGKTEVVVRVFELCEEVLREEDYRLTGYIAIGVLETIQNIASHTDEGYVVFEPFLGPLSLKAWREIEVLWEGKESLADVVRAELADRSEETD